MRISIKNISLLTLFAINTIVAGAQIQNTWEGGTPGRPLDWNIASNWSLNRTPGEFDDVLIPNTSTSTFCYPVIDDVVEINSLRIEASARLTILETGKLILNREGPREGALASLGTIYNRSRNFIEFDVTTQPEKEALANGQKN